MEKRFGQTDVAAVADSSPHDPAQHISPAFVGRQHPVTDEKGGGPAVVGDHFHGHVVGLALAVWFLGQCFGALDDGVDQIGVKIGVHVLDQ